jgi:hypothetical protein
MYFLAQGTTPLEFAAARRASTIGCAGDNFNVIGLPPPMQGCGQEGFDGVTALFVDDR